MYVLDSFVHALNSTTDVFHDFELAPTGNFEFSPVCLVFHKHAGLLQLACMVLYIRPTHCHASLQAQHGIWTLFGQVGDIATECFGIMPKSDDARKSLKLNRFR